MFTVQNEFEFPGDQTVGLPTLVQNPPTANGNGNPTKKSQLSKPVGLPVTEKKEKKIPGPEIDLTAQGSACIT
jgi:hypothetical protein